MDSNGDRFDERRVLVTKSVRQTIDDAPGNGDEIGKRAVAAILAGRNAEDLAIVAKIKVNADTEVAVSAGNCGIEGDTVTWLEIPHIRAGPGHLARGLMTHDDRRL